MVRICAGLSPGLVDFTSAATPAASGVAALVPMVWTYQACCARPAKLKQPKLVPAGGGPAAGKVSGSGGTVPGSPELHAPRTNPVGLHGLPLKAHPPEGKSPPGAERPPRFVPKSLENARQSAPFAQGCRAGGVGGKSAGLVVPITGITTAA